MNAMDNSFSHALETMTARIVPGARGIANLRRLSAGATLETWSFDAVDGERVLHPLILRRSPGGLRSAESLSLEAEAELIRVLDGSGVPVPAVVHTLIPADSLGDGFMMTRIEGETIARKVLRDQQFANIRPHLAAQFGAIRGTMTKVDAARLPRLPFKPAEVIVARLARRYEALGVARPVFDLTFRWLEQNAPAPLDKYSLVHGDYRNGNIIFGAEGVRAVLDWEVAHIGDPAEDLAWISTPPWRFGELDRPVGGLGSRAQLFDAYEAASGERIDPARVHYWEVLGSLRWGVSCASMLEWFTSGRDPSVERAMIARRVSENELDLMRILTGTD
ncbi:phosphotransferase family protein [Bradyrhizobium sp. 1(2017)]|uniref:phosphotransferase family protein n=1 Tax=Bradyrhizobium sp. 1(2017) TaxID=1404888 RepID=UPI002FE51968